MSDSLRLSLRLRLSIGPIEPISGLSWPNFLHIKAHSQGHSRYLLDSQFYHFDCTQFDSTQTKRAISAICLTVYVLPTSPPSDLPYLETRRARTEHLEYEGSLPRA